MSFVCPIHDRYVPDGKRCPYCIEPEAPPDTLRAGLRTVIVRKIAPETIYGTASGKWMGYADACAILKHYYSGGK